MDFWGPRTAQWWEQSPPTNVTRFRFPDPMSYLGWVSCCLVGARPCSEGFFPCRFSGFPPFWKTNISKFQFNLVRGLAWKPARADVASSLTIEIYSFLWKLLSCGTIQSVPDLHINYNLSWGCSETLFVFYLLLIQRSSFAPLLCTSSFPFVTSHS